MFVEGGACLDILEHKIVELENNTQEKVTSLNWGLSRYKVFLLHGQCLRGEALEHKAKQSERLNAAESHAKEKAVLVTRMERRALAAQITTAAVFFLFILI
ncbi:hypothetical protein H0H81_003737, partial [Sphagnurus paluster]